MKITSILGNTRRADITFHASGKIDITSRVTNILNIADGDAVDILTGDGEFYLYVSARAKNIRGRHEGLCRPTRNDSRYFRAYSRRLCDFILKECNEKSNVRLAVGESVYINGIKALLIITKFTIPSSHN